MASVPRLLFPDGHDPRVQEAALRIGADGYAVPVVVGDWEGIGIVGERLGLDPTTVDVLRPQPTGALVEWYARRRATSTAIAARMLERPEVHGAALVATGEGDALVAGATSTTHDLLAACFATFGLAPGARLASSWFLVRTTDRRMFAFADCAVNPEPTAAELAEIALQTARSVRDQLDWVPRVAMLSFSTHGSADHPSVEKVRRATALVREADPALLVDGELQADAAIDHTVAARELDGPQAVAGRANVLVFPDLAAGNIAYKLVRALGGASAPGVFLQGYAWPAVGLSRGVSTDEIVETAAVLTHATRRRAHQLAS